jgi:hypothetical protein
VRQLTAYLDAEHRRLHTDRKERWEHVRLIVAAMNGQVLDEFPDYESPEDGQDLEAIEAALAANPMVVRVTAQE